MAESTEDEDFAEEVAREEVALHPNEAADPQGIVHAKIPSDIRDRFEVFSYRSAAVVLSESHPQELGEILDALRGFSITRAMIRTAGGNESDIPKLLSTKLRPLGWHETVIQGDLLVRLLWREQVRVTKGGRAVYEKKQRELTRARFLDGHKIDYVKGKVAFDLEWNSKDQTFDRDLYAFSAFAQCGVVDAAVLVTRSASLNEVFRKLGPSLKKDGTVEKKPSGLERQTMEKYGASTTWMGNFSTASMPDEMAVAPYLPLGSPPNASAIGATKMRPDPVAEFRQSLALREFATILADPPWRFQNRTGKMAPEHRRLSRYGTMDLAEIMRLPVCEATARTAHLYLWVPNALLPEGIQVLRTWGFEYKSNIVWHKVRKDGGSDGRGVGFYFRNVTEMILFGVKGKNARTQAAGRRQVNYLATQKREHSRKPDELYEIVEACSLGPYMELFARGTRKGWAGWGNQADGYEITWDTYAHHSKRGEIIAAE